MNDSMQELIKFRTALKKLMASEDGKIVLDGLQRMYVDQSALGDSPQETGYRLGQKEFVQGFIRDSQTDINETLLGGNTND